MIKLPRLILLSLTGVMVSCAGTGRDGDWGRDPDRGPPTVSIRADRNSERIVPGARDLMERAGYIVTRDRMADCELNVALDDGPVNAVVDMSFARAGRVLASAQGRSGGPRMIFNRQGVIQDAFDECARKLQPNIPPARGGSYGYGGGRYGSGVDSYDSGRYGSSRPDSYGDGRYDGGRW